MYRKHPPAARVFYISSVFSNASRVLSQCNTQLKVVYLFSRCIVELDVYSVMHHIRLVGYFLTSRPKIILMIMHSTTSRMVIKLTN